MTKLALEQRILEAFSGVPYPGDNEIVDFWMQHAPEAQTLLNDFQGRSWSDLAPELLAAYEFYVCYLSDRAFHYYMPAFLLLIVSDFVESDLLPNILISQINQSLQRLKYFNCVQLDVLIDVMNEIFPDYGKNDDEVKEVFENLRRAKVLHGCMGE